MTRIGTGFALALLVGAGLTVSCTEDEPGAGSGGLGGEGGSTEDPVRVSEVEAQAIAEATTVAGGTVVRKSLPEPSDDPRTPAVSDLRSRDIALSGSELELPFRTELREDGGELRGAYLQLEGADFYWDVPERSLKQNAVASTEDAALTVMLPQLSPGIEFCFTVCVYNSQDLVSQPQQSCVTVPALEDSLTDGIETICAGIEACNVPGGPEDCVTELTRDVAAIVGFAGCDGEAAAVIECVAAQADDCDFLTAIFSEDDEAVAARDPEPTSGTDSGSTGTSGTDSGGTTGDTVIVADAGTTTSSGGTFAEGDTAPAAAFGLVAKQSGMCGTELAEFGMCAEEAEFASAGSSSGGTTSSGGGTTSSGGGTTGDPVVEDAGTDVWDEVDAGTTVARDSGTGSEVVVDGGADQANPCDPPSDALIAFNDAADFFQNEVQAAASTFCSQACTIETVGSQCYAVSDGYTLSSLQDAYDQRTNAFSELASTDLECVGGAPAADLCSATAECVSGSCEVVFPAP